MSALRLHHVSKRYWRGDVSVDAVHDISLEIPVGRLAVLLGPSGSGKSTLLNVIAGLDAPTAGEVVIAGRSTSNFGDADWTKLRRDVIAMVFQAFYLFAGFTAAENVAFPLLLRGESGTPVTRRVAESLELVGLTGRAHHRPGELSGGEQQRVAVARALATRPRLVLADEPTGNLDAKAGEGIVSLLHDITRRCGTTVLMATHSQAAVTVADSVYTLQDGGLALHASG